MRKQYKTYFIPIVVFFVLILQGSNIISDSTFQKPKTSLNDDYSVRKPFLKHQQTINPNKTFLPKTNLTISSYLDTTLENTYNATILSLNRTHWFIHCDYIFLNISTAYNEVSNSWEATYDDHVPYFALINTGTTITLQSITPGGGQIPSFEIFPTLLSLIMISCTVYGKRKSKKIP